MNNESIEKLRLDRRLHSRRGWIAEKDLQAELDALPDVSDKIRPDDEEPQPDTTGDGGTPAPEAASTVSPGSLEGGGA
jgi:hypothetical protein